MQTLFHPDSKLMQGLSRLYDLALLNCVFLLTCLPVVTIGAASAALYAVCLSMDTQWEQGILRTYFRAFRANFRQGTVLWLLFAVFFGAGLFDMALFFRRQDMAHYLYLPVGALLLVGLMAYGYAFPLLSRFSNTLRGTLKNALLMSIGYLPRSLAMAALNLLPLALLMLAPYLFFLVGFVWLFLYFALAAYLNSRLLGKVFAPYLSREEDEGGLP